MDAMPQRTNTSFDDLVLNPERRLPCVIVADHRRCVTGTQDLSLIAREAAQRGDLVRLEPPARLPHVAECGKRHGVHPVRDDPRVVSFREGDVFGARPEQHRVGAKHRTYPARGRSLLLPLPSPR